jgi:hypothetical protein
LVLYDRGQDHANNMSGQSFIAKVGNLRRCGKRRIAGILARDAFGASPIACEQHFRFFCESRSCMTMQAHRHQWRRGYRRRHRFPRPHGVHCARRFGQRCGTVAGQDQELDCKVIVSEQVCQIAGIPDDALTRMDVKIRGRDESVTVRMAADPTILVNLLDSQSVNTEAELAEADIQG